mgnify:CR=1 FL=1
MNMMELVRSRRSVRSFDGNGIPEDIREEILRYANEAATPYGLPIVWKILDAKTHGLSSPVITGADAYIAGKLRRAPHGEEAFGYAMESIVLFAASKGIGTTVIAGTMDRPAFERAMSLAEGEIMPCVSPLGYPAAKMSLRESLMRKGIKADSRLPFEELFFDGDLRTPLTPEKAGELAEVLEMVRWAPSAVNKQPWRAVLRGDTICFYEKKSKGFVSADGWDTQKVDMGIALCHFARGMEERGRRLEFLPEDPSLVSPDDLVFIAAYRILP